MFNMQQKKSFCIKVLQEKGKSADEFENFTTNLLSVLFLLYITNFQTICREL